MDRHYNGFHRVYRSGNSLCVTIPQSWAARNNIGAGSIFISEVLPNDTLRFKTIEKHTREVLFVENSDHPS